MGYSKPNTDLLYFSTMAMSIDFEKALVEEIG